MVQKILVKQRKHLSLARKSFKNQENKREAGNILQKREVFGQNGKIGVSAVYFKDNFSQHSIGYISNIQGGGGRGMISGFTLTGALKNRFIMLVASSSPDKFSKIVFPVWNFVQSLKSYYENNFYQS